MYGGANLPKLKTDFYKTIHSLNTVQSHYILHGKGGNGEEIALAGSRYYGPGETNAYRASPDSEKSAAITPVAGSRFVSGNSKSFAYVLSAEGSHLCC